MIGRPHFSYSHRWAGFFLTHPGIRMEIGVSFYPSKWPHNWVLWFSNGRFLSTWLRVHRWGWEGCHPSMACCLRCCRLVKFLLAPDDKWPGWTHLAWTLWQQMVLDVLNTRLGKFCHELFDNYISAFLKLVPIRKISLWQNINYFPHQRDQMPGTELFKGGSSYFGFQFERR